jgi:aminoglycoside phosphotransferase (APT) family kinase protein
VSEPTSGLTDAELAGIAAVMTDAGAAPAGPLTAALIAGGRSNLTFRLTDGSSTWVLRMPPRTGRTPSAHDVAREYRVTSALMAADVPVPPAVALCEDEDVVGFPFAVAAYVPGRTIQARSQLDELDDTTLTGVTAALVDTLVSLHRVDHVAVGLERFGRPDGYAERQFRRWLGQWELVSIPEQRGPDGELVRRLGAALPEQRATGIVHGDFRIDNTLLNLERHRVAAVVDWELATIGDPVADVAMMCAYRDPSFDLIVGEPAAWTSPRLPDPAALASRYEAAGGIPLVDWKSHLAMAYFKIGVIAAGIDHRRRVGSGAGRGFDTSGEAVVPFHELGLAALR